MCASHKHKQGFFTSSKMRCKSHVTITVGLTSEWVQWRRKKRRTFVRIIFIGKIFRRGLLVAVTGDWIGCQSELIGCQEEKDIQRNVNVSPGAAPATSLFTSRSCQWCMCQRQSRIKGRVGFNDHVITTGLREVGELGVVLHDGNVFWGVSVGF